MRGDHALGEVVATQVPTSLSSGESEFYALLRAADEAKFLRNLWCWLGFDEPQDPPEIVSDATAALGAAARLGVGLLCLWSCAARLGDDCRHLEKVQAGLGARCHAWPLSRAAWLVKL